MCLYKLLLDPQFHIFFKYQGANPKFPLDCISLLLSCLLGQGMEFIYGHHLPKMLCGVGW